MTASSHVPMPVPNRPLGALEMCDGALSILRSSPKTVAGIAAAFVLPSQLLSAWLSRNFFASFTLDNFDTQTGQFENQDELSGLSPFQGSPVATILAYLILPFLGVALTHLVIGWRDGVDYSIKDCLLFTLRKSQIIVVAFVLAKLIQAVTLLFATPILILVAPIIAAEGAGPFAAIRRSFSLGRRRYGQLFSLVLLVGLINVLLGYAMAALPLLGAFLLGEWGWVVFFALGAIGATVLNILGVGAAVLAYLDVRVRTEGSDLTQRIHTARIARV